METETNNKSAANKDHSVDFLLAEYSRIQELEVHNRDSGNTRFNIYLTLISISSAGLWTFWGTLNKQSISELNQFYLICLLVTVFLSLIGLQAFRIFVNRWVFSVIYLRKLSRIRKWFLDRDSSLRSGLTYTVDETKPSFLLKSVFSLNLLALVVVFNSTFISIATWMLMLLIDFRLSTVWYLAICLLVFFSSLFCEQYVFKKILIKQENDAYAAFPITLGDQDEQKV